MSLVGRTISRYRVTQRLGGGGMGELYLAEDTTLRRSVAIKVLHRSLFEHPGAIKRFHREAEATAALSHPNIVTTYEISEHEGSPFIAMEYVEGTSLEQRIQDGRLSAREAIDLTIQLLDGLEFAHRAGIVHRDVKPANIIVGTDGRLRILDFGLARVADASRITESGTTVGTLSYMSPEQSRGEKVDARSDIFSSGCVLYEMITGQLPFESEHRAAVAYAIAHEDPQPMARYQRDVSPELERIVSRALAKDPARRYQSAADMRSELAALGTRPASGRRTRMGALALAVVGAVAATAVVTVLITTRMYRPDGKAPASSTVQRYSVCSADLVTQSAPMISPDGAAVVFSAHDGTTHRLYRRDLASFDVAPVPGTEGGASPFFSPDGKWIGFVTLDAIKKIPAEGGTAQIITAEPLVNAADWGADGTIYFTTRGGGRDGVTALARVPAGGGRVERVAVLDTTTGEVEAWLPEILPDGKTVLITIGKRSEPVMRLVAFRPDGSLHSVIANAMLGRYVHPGRLLYFDFGSGAVLAAPFDPERMEITGPAIPLTEPIDYMHAYDVLDDGALVYVPRDRTDREIVWLDRTGVATPILNHRSTWAQPRLSPDGTRIVLRKVMTYCELWMFDLEHGALGRIAHGGDSHDPVWSPDGRRIAFAHLTGSRDVVTLVVDGTRSLSTIAELSGERDLARPQSWSADDNLLVYSKTGRGTQGDIAVLRLDGSSAPETFLATEFDETHPVISRDGKWIAYASNETGAPEVFVRRYPDDGSVWPISIGGGDCPLWSRDGRELYFVAGAKMMASAIETDPVFRAGAPRELFDGGFSAASARDFDVAADGRFVAVAHPRGKSALKEVKMLLNWREEVNRMNSTRR